MAEFILETNYPSVTSSDEFWPQIRLADESSENEFEAKIRLNTKFRRFICLAQF